MKKLSYLTPTLLLLPGVAFAAGLNDFLLQLSSWITTLIPMLISVAVLLFLWGLVKFMFNAGDEGAKDEGKRIMIWGIITLFIMVGFWGIVGWLQTTLNVNDTVNVVSGPTSVTGLTPN